MPLNVEIKAKVRDFQKLCKLAKDLCLSEPEVLHQEDTFYKVSFGRLKLRKFQSGAPSQLVFYNRPDTEGPKLSDYSICPISNPEELDSVLKTSLGIIGKVEKTRHLFIYEQTRIHLDSVVDLGNFMELEVVLRPDQTIEEGQQIANNLMVKLNVLEEDLISGAYLDHLIK